LGLENLPKPSGSSYAELTETVCGLTELGEGVLAHVGGAVYWLTMSGHLDADMIVEIEKTLLLECMNSIYLY
jgi:hypothetical protein